MPLAGLCPGLGTCPRPASGNSSSGQNVATLTRRQSLSSHPELSPGSWGQVPPDTNWSGGKRLPSQTDTGPPRVPPRAQGPGWCSPALPPRVTPGPKFSWPCQSGTGAEPRAQAWPLPAQPQGPQAGREGRLPTPPHLALAPRVCGREFPPPLLSLPPPALCPLPASGTAPAPASGQQGPHPSSLGWPLCLAGGWGVRLLGNPPLPSSHQSSSPAPKLWVAVPFPVEQETRLFPRL